MGRRADRRRFAAAERASGEQKINNLIAESIAARAGGTGITPWELPVTVACRNLLADTLAQLPLGTEKNRRSTEPPGVIVRPDPWEPAWLTTNRMVNNLTGAGYFWLWVTSRDAAGRPSSVRVLDAAQATAEWDPVSGRMTGVWFDGNRHSSESVIWVPWHVPAAGNPGVSPLMQCWKAAEGLCALFDMMFSFWEAGFPSIAVMVSQALSATQSRELKEQVMSSWSRRHEPAVIDRDGTLETVGSSAVESQLVESIIAANQEIARAHLVMPSMVNVSSADGLTYSTTIAEFRKFLIVGLGGYMMRIEAGFTDLLPYGTSARFNVDELERSDLYGRAQAYQLALAGQPWLTVDEVRDVERRDPMPASERPPITEEPPVMAPRLEV
jgi:phage portal protein BeeE